MEQDNSLLQETPEEIASRLFAQLLTKNKIPMNGDYLRYDTDVKRLMETMAEAVKCLIVTDESYIYLIPVSQTSPLHMGLSDIKKEFFGAAGGTSVGKETVYLVYTLILLLLVLFYEDESILAHHLPVEEKTWLNEATHFFRRLKEKIQEEKDFAGTTRISWKELISAWEAMDTTNQKDMVKSKTQMTLIRIAENILRKSECIEKINAEREIYLTALGETIVQNYQHMDATYSQVQFMKASLVSEKEDEEDAIH